MLNLTLEGAEFVSADLLGSGLLEACYPLEHEPGGPFVWTQGRFHLRAPGSAKFVVLKLGYLGKQGAIHVLHDGIRVDSAPLREGWQQCALKLGVAPEWLSFEVDPVQKVAGDGRELGVMLRSVLLSNDTGRFVRSRQISLNAILNDTEFRHGSPVLASHPPNLRISTEVRCNIPETGQACTYCAWDWAKKMERGSPAFKLDTLDELGGFYHDAQLIGDCSIGEPAMNRDFAAILSRFDGDDKEFSFTTNGQLLVERRRRELLGKRLEVYVSLDAATPEGFKRYRNDQFDRIIGNIRALCAEKRLHSNLPRVTASFIAMRSNVDELESYIRLMKEVGVDRVKLRTLYLDNNLETVVINNGYRFDYADEILSRDELDGIRIRARELAAEHEMPLYVEWDQFEPATADRDEPLCAEPWKTLYVLGRGIMPCCYATEPLAKWEDQGNRSLDEFLRDTFNSAQYQELRSELAAGRLAPYCRNAPSCPVLKRMSDDIAPHASWPHAERNQTTSYPEKPSDLGGVGTHTNEPRTAISYSLLQPEQPMRNVLLQTSDPSEYAVILETTARTSREFCRRQGLEYRSFIGVKQGFWPWHSTYNRIHMMKELLDEGHLGWVLYLDADAYVCDLDFPIVDYLKENDRFAMVAVRINSTAEYWDINAGVVFINFGHPLGRRIVKDLVERLAGATQAPQFVENQWPHTDLWLDDQSLLHTTLMKNPDWQRFIRHEPQTFMNSLHASFIRHHLRAMTPDLGDRLRSIEAAVDQVLGSSADES